jgi:hypothetical protein
MGSRYYYHGTQKVSAHSIMRQGFKIGEESSGRNLGAGLYLSSNVGFAAVWGPILIRCTLRSGTRLLWHTQVDQRTIRHLKKEFGAGITEPNFNTQIPYNKQLTKSEIAHLWNFLLDRHYLKMPPSRRDFFPTLAHNFPFIYKHLRRHGYDGVGIQDDAWPEMFLFNPSNAVPISAHFYTSTGWRDIWVKENVELSEPLTLAELDELQKAERRQQEAYEPWGT